VIASGFGGITKAEAGARVRDEEEGEGDGLAAIPLGVCSK